MPAPAPSQDTASSLVNLWDSRWSAKTRASQMLCTRRSGHKLVFTLSRHSLNNSCHKGEVLVVVALGFLFLSDDVDSNTSTSGSVSLWLFTGSGSGDEADANGNNERKDGRYSIDIRRFFSIDIRVDVFRVPDRNPLGFTIPDCSFDRAKSRMVASCRQVAAGLCLGCKQCRVLILIRLFFSLFALLFPLVVGRRKIFSSCCCMLLLFLNNNYSAYES